MTDGVSQSVRLGAEPQILVIECYCTALGRPHLTRARVCSLPEVAILFIQSVPHRVFVFLGNEGG